MMEDHNELDFVAEDHDQLINAVKKLDKTQHITVPINNEPTNVNSEYNLNKRPEKSKAINVVEVFNDTAYHVKIGKKLKTSQERTKILSKPLEKPQAERIERATYYMRAKEKISKWDPVVARNRTVDFVTFPLKKFSTKVQPTKEFISKLELKSSLEKELEEVDPPASPEPEEDEKEYLMTYQEMLEYKKNMAKIRAQQSYKAAKAKRQSKIKSKKYHRILKKEKLKQQLKEFEDLQSSNPEKALKKLEQLEKARALERHTLRHKNTGKWAKNKLIRAKYDKEVRLQLAEQLAVSKSLTQKTVDTETTDDEQENDEVIPDITVAQDPMNPWMMKRSDKTNIDAEFDFGYKKYVNEKFSKQNDETESESEEESSKNATELDENSKVDCFRALTEGLQKLGNKNNDTIEKKNSKKSKTQKNTVSSTSTWVVESIDETIDVQPYKKKTNTRDISEEFEIYEAEIAKKVENKLKRLREEIDKFGKVDEVNSKQNKKHVSNDHDNVEYLKLRKQNVKPVIDEELFESSTKEPNEIETTMSTSNNIHKIASTPSIDPNAQGTNNIDIDPNKFINVKPKHLNSALSNSAHELDDLDDDQVVPKRNIEEMFEEDDVVDSFRQEKEDEINKNKLPVISQSLPGWGSWGGIGVKAPKRKRNRFIGKLPPKVARRDENKGDIIINEYKDPKLSVHKVTDLPFPFTRVRDYEASIRAPLGNTFIPEKAHKNLIKPAVITKAGAIIEPMDEEELLVKRKFNFKNEAIIKLLDEK